MTTIRNTTRKTKTPRTLLLPLLALLFLALPAVVAANHLATPDPQRVRISVAGSTTLAPFLRAAIEDFATEEPGVEIHFDFAGTDKGLLALAAGSANVVGASRSIQPAEAETLGDDSFFEVPVAYDGVVVFAHPGLGFVDHLTFDELRAIWTGDVETWAEVRSGWPDRPLRLEAPESGSGTVTSMLQAISAEDGLRPEAHRNESSLATARRTASRPGSLGFSAFGAADTLGVNVRLIPIDGDEGVVEPTRPTLADGSYPLGRPLFVYASARSPEHRIVVELLGHLVSESVEQAQTHGLLPLPEAIRRSVRERLDRRITGSALAAGVERAAEAYADDSAESRDD